MANEKTKKKILFFDDESFISKIMVDNLKLNYCERNGWEIQYVSEIPLVFQELISTTYDLIILDVMISLPDQNEIQELFTKSEYDKMEEGMRAGYVVAEKIWSIPKYRNVPILFLSARINENLFNDKKTAFIRKPELASVIAKKIQEMC